MINAIKTLLNKTSELEEKVDNIKLNQTNNNQNNNFVCFSKGLINLSFLNSNKLNIAEFETIQNNSLYFQNQIELNIPVSQNIKISLIINDIAIYRSTRKLQSGYNQLTIMKSYTPLKNEQVKLYLEIVAEDNSLITIISDTLFVWGLNNIANNIEYQAIEISDKFVLSYLNNNTIYYSMIDKNEAILNSEDLTYYGNALSYNFVYLDDANILYLFRVDLDGNLFFTDFNKNYEKFIDSNISHISCACNGSIILISVVKNNNCYTFEMDELENFSIMQKLECYNLAINSTYLYFNKNNNKFYIVLTDKNNSNYILETVNEISTEHSFINAVYSIEYSTYEVEV